MADNSTDYIRTTTAGNGNPDNRIYYGNSSNSKDSNAASSANALGYVSSFLNTYQQQFLSSAAVAEAIRLFQSSPNPEPWLARLRAIVESIITPNPTFISSIGEQFTGDLDGTAALTTAFTNLNNLVSEFHQWFNSLPAEQRSQYDAAGLNIALDGGSAITGSSVPSASVQSSNVVEAANASFDNAVNFVTSIGGGLLGLIGAVQSTFKLSQSQKQISITEDTTLADINQKRLALGLSPLAKLSDVSSQKVIDTDELSSFGIRSKNEQEAASKQSRVTLETEVNPLYDAVDNAARLDVAPYNEVMAQIGNVQLATKLYNQLYQNELTNFNLEQQKIKNQVLSEYGGELALGEAQTALEEQFAKRAEFKRSAALEELGETLINYKKDMLKDWIAKANSGSADSFIYSSLLMKSGLNLSDFMGPAEVGLDYMNKGSDILDDLLGIINPLGWFKAVAKGKGKGAAKAISKSKK